MVCAYADPRHMLEHIPGLPDLILFWMNDVSVIRVSRCGLTRGTLSRVNSHLDDNDRRFV